MPTCVGPRIRLALFGCTNRPFFHIIVTEGRRKRNTGRSEQVNHNFCGLQIFSYFCRLAHLTRCQTLAAKNSWRSTSKESSEWACQCGGVPLHYYYYYYYFVKVLVGGRGHAHKTCVQDPRIGESLVILLKAART